MIQKFEIGQRVQVLRKDDLQKCPKWNARKSSWAGYHGTVTDAGYSAAEGCDVAEVHFDGHKKPSHVKWRPEELAAEGQVQHSLPTITVSVEWAEPGDDAMRVTVKAEHEKVRVKETQTVRGANGAIHALFTGAGLTVLAMKMTMDMLMDAHEELMVREALEAQSIYEEEGEDTQTKLEDC